MTENKHIIDNSNPVDPVIMSKKVESYSHMIQTYVDAG
jgi:hypothetical protein